MIKLVYCVARHPEVDRQAFHRYWLEEHGPRVRRLAGALRADHYVQSHTLDTPINDQLAESRGSRPGYDGITEVWWQSMEELESALATEPGQAAAAELVEDESRFIDFSRSSLFLTEEHAIF